MHVNPHQHHPLVHPCIVLTCIYHALRVRGKLAFDNPPIRLPLKKEEKKVRNISSKEQSTISCYL